MIEAICCIAVAVWVVDQTLSDVREIWQRQRRRDS
jgi:hypothetical protein